MKLNIYIVVVSCILLFSGCTKMEDIHSEFSGDGQSSYAPLPKEVETYAGKNRVKIKYLVTNGINVTKAVIEWEENNELQSKTIDFIPNTPIDSLEIVIDGLEEKSYLFYVYNLDKYGNRSVKQQVTATSYAERYSTALTNRSLASVNGGGTIDSVEIFLATPEEGYAGLEATYNTKDGQLVTKILESTKDRLVIRGWEPEGELTYRSKYLPEENAIDTFYSEFDKVILPDFIEFTGVLLPKDSWQIVDFSSEHSTKPIGAVIDGDYVSAWHTQWKEAQPGYPHWFIVDLNEVAKLNQFECYKKPDMSNGQTEFQLYTSLDGVDFTLQGTFPYDQSLMSQRYNLSSLPLARYVKYVATKPTGTEFFANLAELDLFGKVASKIDKSQWEIIDFSDEHPPRPITNVIDDDYTTLWNSQWKDVIVPYPHWFVVDMKESIDMIAVECARPAGRAGGQTKFKIYTSNDGVNFEDQGTFDFNANLDGGQVFSLAFLPTARYVKYEAIEGPGTVAFMAEFSVLGSISN